MEIYANVGTAVLNNGSTLSSGATTTTVTSQVNVPSSGTFRVLIESEIIKVTAVSGNTWTISRGDGGTSAASHADGLTAYLIVTKESLDALVSIQADGTETSNRRVLNFINFTVADNSGSTRCDITDTAATTGTTSGLPAAGDTNKNHLYLPTDGPIIQQSSGSAWSPYGPLFPLTKPPAAGTWTTSGISGSITLSDSNAGPVLHAPGNSGTAVYRMALISAPATPYTITAGFLAQGPINANLRWGLIWRNSSSTKIISFGHTCNGGPLELNVSQFNSSTSFSSNPLTVNWATFAPVLWLRIKDDGSNRTYYTSADGVNWTQQFTDTHTNFFTPDQVGWGLYDNGNSSVNFDFTLISWLQS
jgi:hypothetical protein